MKDQNKTKAQLFDELQITRRRIDEMEKTISHHKQTIHCAQVWITLEQR